MALLTNLPKLTQPPGDVAPSRGNPKASYSNPRLFRIVCVPGRCSYAITHNMARYAPQRAFRHCARVLRPWALPPQEGRPLGGNLVQPNHTAVQNAGTPHSAWSLSGSAAANRFSPEHVLRSTIPCLSPVKGWSCSRGCDLGEQSLEIEIEFIEPLACSSAGDWLVRGLSSCSLGWAGLLSAQLRPCQR